MIRIAAMIMAAGRGARFGGCKQLAQIDGRPMLQHVVDSARTVCFDNVYVLTGAWHAGIADARRLGAVSGCRLIYNEEWARGLGASIARGVRELAPSYQGILILLADQVAVGAADLNRLLRPFDGANVVCAAYGGSRGVPAVFGASSFGALTALQGERGAKALLLDGGAAVVECPMDSAVVDVDTPESLGAATSALRLGEQERRGSLAQPR